MPRTIHTPVSLIGQCRFLNISSRCGREIDRLLREAKKREHPNFWQYLENFGQGMASTPSRNWGQAIAGGARGMATGINAQEDEARKDQLTLLGVSSKLDDQMRAAQEKAASAAFDQQKVQQQALNDASNNQARLEAERIRAQNAAAAAAGESAVGRARARHQRRNRLLSGTSDQLTALRRLDVRSRSPHEQRHRRLVCARSYEGHLRCREVYGHEPTDRPGLRSK